MGPARQSSPPDSVLLARVRDVLLTLVVLATAGMAADLLLLGHYEDAWQLPPLVVIGIGLCVAVLAGRSATDADILSIPGAGPRMVCEFKEYRPWKTREQFMREIGKYVGEKETERLWRYVVID